MPVALGFHTDVQTQAALNGLLAEVQAERKRAVVVQGAQGRMVTVLNKGNPMAELLRSLTGQTRREAQRLEQFRASLPQGPQAQAVQAVAQAVQPPKEQPAPAPAVQIVHEAALDAALEAAHAALLPPVAAQFEPRQPAAQAKALAAPDQQQDPAEDLPHPIAPPGYRSPGQAAPTQEATLRPAAQTPPGSSALIDGVDPALQRAAMADLEDAQAPQLRESLAQLEQALADLRQNHPARYASLKRAIEADLHALVGAPRPSANQIARIRANLQALDECSHRWRGADARMDAAGMNHLRAANAVRHESEASDAERARRAAVGTLLNASRRILATDHQAAQRGQRLPDGWTAAQSRDAQAIYRSAQTLGLEDAAVLPLWLGSIEEGSHQQFIAEAVAVLERWR